MSLFFSQRLLNIFDQIILNIFNLRHVFSFDSLLSKTKRSSHNYIQKKFFQMFFMRGIRRPDKRDNLVILSWLYKYYLRVRTEEAKSSPSASVFKLSIKILVIRIHPLEMGF